MARKKDYWQCVAEGICPDCRNRITDRYTPEDWEWRYCHRCRPRRKEANKRRYWANRDAILADQRRKRARERAELDAQSAQRGRRRAARSWRDRARDAV